jgi:hypothetical protein
VVVGAAVVVGGAGFGVGVGTVGATVVVVGAAVVVVGGVVVFAGVGTGAGATLHQCEQKPSAVHLQQVSLVPRTESQIKPEAEQLTGVGVGMVGVGLGVGFAGVGGGVGPMHFCSAHKEQAHGEKGAAEAHCALVHGLSVSVFR